MDCSNAQGHHPGARSSSGPGARGSARHPPGAGRSQAAIGAHAVALSHPRGGLPLRSAPGRGAPIGAALARSAYWGGPGAERLFGRPWRGAHIWFTTPPMADHDDSFELYDLRVEVVAPPGARLWCSARPGDWFEVRGELIYLPPDQGFSLYSLAAVLPLLAAKQRVSDPNDWMESDAEVACPDPNCPSRLRITRLGVRQFRRADTTATAKPD